MRLEEKTYKWVKVWTSVYLVIMFLVFPLYYQNNYINMLEAKTSFFVTVTSIYIIGGVVWMLLERLSGMGADEKQNKKGNSRHVVPTPETERKKCWLIQDVFFVIFVIAVGVSTVTSGDMGNAWIAPDCKMFGAIIILLCCGIYVIAGKGFAQGIVVKAAFCAGMFAVLTLTVLNRYGIDPLDMYSNLAVYQKGIYLSTIGNANILSNFICIFIPVIMGMFMYETGNILKLIYGILLYLGVMAGIATNSDSFFLGLGASVIFYLWFAMDSKGRLASYLAAGSVGSVAMVSLKLFNRWSDYGYEWNELQFEFISTIPWLLIAAVFTAAAVLLFKTEKELPLKKIRNILFILLGAGLILLIILMIRVNMGVASVQNGYLMFDDDWGTNRGFVWSRTCLLFNELPFYQQVTGIGPGGFRDFFATYNMDRAANGLDDFVDPHSEFLYFLVATGVIGVIGYFGMIIAAIVKCLKIRTDMLIILAAVFVSWIAQGTVNNPLVFVTPYLFLFLGLSRYEMKK